MTQRWYHIWFVIFNRCRGEGEVPMEAAAMDSESRLVSASDCY